jgi:hypothetical protein
MVGLFFDNLAEHRSCQERLWGRSEMKKRLTYLSLMGYETLMPPMLRWLLDTFDGDARALGAISLNMQRWRDNQPQKGRFPGRD